MILLARDCMVFQMSNGESIPLSAQTICVELVSENISGLFDSEFLEHAASAVFHYFKNDLGRESVTVGEFTLALEKVLVEFQQGAQSKESTRMPVQADLRELAAETNDSELFFFPRLRDELRIQLQHSPKIISFSGLRDCVKQLLGAQRWSSRCRIMEKQILEFLQRCVQAEAKDACSLLVL
jgi:hypothetical protein